MVISGMCIIAVDNAKRIASFQVFIITASFSMFAYIWLLIILMGTSPNIVEVWEGVLTLVWMPLLIIIAYCADINIIARFRNRQQAAKKAGACI